MAVLTKVIFLAVLSAVAFSDDYGYGKGRDGGGYHDEHYEPQPYHFGYRVKDHYGEQHREEASDGHGSVKGSYGFVDEKGVHREVHYVADERGFRAQVKTNEPGTSNQQPANVAFHSDSHDFMHFHGEPKHHAPYQNEEGYYR